jgi:hypothetical protein
MAMWLRASALLLGAAVSFELEAQGMAAAAEKAKQRRAQQTANAPAKSYGNDDLGSAGAPVANDTSIAPAAAAPGDQSIEASMRAAGIDPTTPQSKSLIEALKYVGQAPPSSSGRHERERSAGAELARLRAAQVRAMSPDPKVRQAEQDLRAAEAAAGRALIGNPRVVQVPQEQGITRHPGGGPTQKVVTDPAAPFSNKGQAGVDAAKAALDRAKAEAAAREERERRSRPQ